MPSWPITPNDGRSTCAATARPPCRWTRLTHGRHVERRRRGQGERLAVEHLAARVENGLLAEVLRVALLSLGQQGADARARRFGGARVGEQAHDVALLDARDLHAGEHDEARAGRRAARRRRCARCCGRRSAIIASPSRSARVDDRRRRHLVVRARREGRVHVQVCRTGGHASGPWSMAFERLRRRDPSGRGRTGGRRPRRCRRPRRRGRGPPRPPWRRSRRRAGARRRRRPRRGRRGPATAITLRCTCSVTSRPPDGALARTSLNRSEAYPLVISPSTASPAAGVSSVRPSSATICSSFTLCSPRWVVESRPRRARRTGRGRASRDR